MRSLRFLSTSLALAFCAIFCVTSATAQTWWVQSADYGFGNRRTDVTNTVRRLVNGPNFKVNNTNLGVDPAVGKDKTLRIVARDQYGKVRDFSYNEGSTVDARMFRGAAWNGGGGPGPNNGMLRIVNARWGYQNRTQNVTGRLQSLVRNNRLSVKVNPQNMGGDPAPGVGKTVYVTYEFNGRRRETSANEGEILNLP